MGTHDPRDFRGRLQRQRELLAESSDTADADKTAIKRFLRDKDGTVEISTLKTYMRRLRRAAEWASVPLVEMTKDDYQDLIFELRHNDDYGRGQGGLADSTLKSYEDIVCQFLVEHCDRDWADNISRTKVDRSTVSADAMLKPDDIQSLRSAARHQRDIALIEFLADTGARISLVASLRVQDVSVGGDRATYTPNSNAIGLKGADITPYPIIDSRAELRTYLHGAHPRGDEPDAALFHKLRRFDEDIDVDDGGLDPSFIRNHLVRIGKQAGLEKPTNPHNFRHSAITRMVREGFSRDQIEHRVHWSLDTDMWERYVHITAEELNDDIFADAGITDRDERTEQRRRNCGNCRETLAPHHEFCPTCGEAATPQARSQVDDAEKAGLDTLASGDLSPLERQAIAAALQAVRQENDRVNVHD